MKLGRACDDRQVLEALEAALPNWAITPPSEITLRALCI